MPRVNWSSRFGVRNQIFTTFIQAGRQISQQPTKALDGSNHYVRDMELLVLLSEWAKLDAITLPVYQQLFTKEYIENLDAMNIEKSHFRSISYDERHSAGAFAFGFNSRL